MKKVVLGILMLATTVAMANETNISVTESYPTKGTPRKPTTGASLTTTVAGPVTAGAFALGDGTVGLSAGLNAHKSSGKVVNLSLLGAISPQNAGRPTSIGASVTNEVIKHMSVGAFGLSNGLLGVSAGIQF